MMHWIRSLRQITSLTTTSNSHRLLTPRTPFKAPTNMPNKYIVVFKDGVTQDQIDEYANKVDSNGGEVTNRYTDVLKGFAATITDEQLQSFQSLQDKGIIDYIEPDGVVTTQ